MQRFKMLAIFSRTQQPTDLRL